VILTQTLDSFASGFTIRKRRVGMLMVWVRRQLGWCEQRCCSAGRFAPNRKVITFGCLGKLWCGRAARVWATALLGGLGFEWSGMSSRGQSFRS